MINGVIASLIAAIVCALVSFLLRNRHILKAAPLCLFWQRQQRVRISIAVLLRVVVDGEFLLVRMALRQEALGPLGGVLWFYPSALRELTDIGFNPQLPPLPEAGGAQDLRGFLRARDLPRFVRWFWSEKDREDSLACLSRKLRTTCRELALPVTTEDIEALRFNFMWRVVEGPRLPWPDSDYLQFRVLDIFDLTDDLPANHYFKGVLLKAAEGNPVAAVSSNEIRIGRMAAEPRAPIAHHSCYLLTRRRLREEAPPF